MGRVVQDKDLLQALKEGQSSAVAYWFKTYQPRLRRLVLAKVSIEADAEDLVQEIFINCLKHLPLFRGEASIWTWMTRIASHEIADYYRKRYAKKAIRALALDDLIPMADISDAKELADEVQQTMRQLKDKQRLLLTMKYIEQKTVVEIANYFNQSLKSIESELFRARREFKLVYAEQSII